MEDSKRPAGLTIFAVINFILAFFSLLTVFSLVLLVTFTDQLPLDAMGEAQRNNILSIADMPAGLFMFMISKSVIGCLLLILSGIGYLKQNRILGYVMGNIYAAVIIIHTVISPYILETEKARGLIGWIIVLLYPVITLIILNLVFRKNFNSK